MRSLWTIVGLLALACGGVAGPGAELPDWDETIVVVGPASYRAANPVSGEVIRWAPREVAAAGSLLAEPHVFVHDRLVALSGRVARRAFADPVPAQVLGPDGRLAWAVFRGGSKVLVGGIDDEVATVLAEPGAEPGWLADGRLCFTDASTPLEGGRSLACVDPDAPEAVEIVYQHAPGGIRAAAWHRSGAVAFVDADTVWVLRPGEAAVSLSPAVGDRPSSLLAWSPDGSHLAFGVRTGDGTGLGVWAGDGPWRILLEPDRGAGPVAWAPDGARLAVALTGECRRDHAAQRPVCERDVFVVDVASAEARPLTDEAFVDPIRLAWVSR